MKDKEYLYIGEYYREGVNLQEMGITEKKIGITKKPSKRADGILSGTKNTIGFKYIKLWEIEDAQRLEHAIHSLLKNDRLNGEWFKDPNLDLCKRVIPIMEFVEASEVSLDGFYKDQEDSNKGGDRAELRMSWWKHLDSKLEGTGFSIKNTNDRGYKDFSLGINGAWLCNTFLTSHKRMDTKAVFVKGETDEVFQNTLRLLGESNSYEYDVYDSNDYNIIAIRYKCNVSDRNSWDTYSTDLIDRSTYLRDIIKS